MTPRRKGMYPRRLELERLDLEGWLRKPPSERWERRAFQIGGAARGSASSGSTGQGVRRASHLGTQAEANCGSLGTLIGSSDFIGHAKVFSDLRAWAYPIKYDIIHPSHTKKKGGGCFYMCLHGIIGKIFQRLPLLLFIFVFCYIIWPWLSPLFYG